MRSSDLVAFFNDGSSSPVFFRGDTGTYHENGIPQGFTIGLAVRGDGYRRVVFLDGDQEQQADPWIASIGRRPGLSIIERCDHPERLAVAP